MAKKIYINPGHGGSDFGAVKGGRKEKDDVLRLALRLAESLKGQDVEVRLSRSTDTDASIGKSVQEANEWKADYYLSIHRNSAAGGATGNEIWVYSGANQATVLKARAILDAVCAVDGLPDRGVRKGAPSYTDFGVNRDTLMPAALLELGFISNDADNRAFDKHMEAYAENLARVLCAVVGVVYRPAAPEPKALYRVRKTWQDEQSQLGAFESLDNAKAATKPGYTVFDEKGQAVYAVPQRPAGDVDGDGVVTATDARQALRASAGLEKLNEEQKKAADMDGDGNVTASDARKILRKSAGIDED